MGQDLVSELNGQDENLISHKILTETRAFLGVTIS